MFKLIFYSFLHSPFSVSLSSLPLHLFFLPPQTHRPFFLPQRPIVDLHKPSRHKPVAADPRLAADLTHFSLSSLFSAFQFCVSAVLVFWLCVSGCACVLALCFGLACVSDLCFGLGFCFGHGFRFLFRDGFVFRAVIFLLSFFFLLHWFWWARRGCGYVVIFMGLMVVVVMCWWLNEILFYRSVYIISLC